MHALSLPNLGFVPLPSNNRDPEGPCLTTPPETDLVRTFVAGFLGSLAVELVAMDELFHKSSKLPKRYYLLSFWCVRAFLACMGGTLACYYGIQNAVAAFQVGASTPAIIKSLAKFQRR
jgi:hypothetical protein